MISEPLTFSIIVAQGNAPPTSRMAARLTKCRSAAPTPPPRNTIRKLILHPFDEQTASQRQACARVNRIFSRHWLQSELGCIVCHTHEDTMCHAVRVRLSMAERKDVRRFSGVMIPAFASLTVLLLLVIALTNTPRPNETPP